MPTLTLTGATAMPTTTAGRGDVRIDHVTQVFKGRRGEVLAVDDVSLEARGSEFVSILGPSGCGKSSLFHVVAGLRKPTTGDVFIHGERVTGQTGHVSYMPQRDNLLPWRTVLDNTILGLEVEGVSRKEARERARELCVRFGLGEFTNALPRELSGGMRQRAAFIRTMLFPREVMLLDEPLGALDAQTRLLMQEWLLDVWGELGKTVLFITHDVDEAVFLSDRVYVMSARPGRFVAEVKVDLPRPRDAHLRVTDEFVELRNELLEQIRTETLKSFEGVSA
jgi:ABC-type nitrate/sulfonate/bicarbonate transport system ATPase subunit